MILEGKISKTSPNSADMFLRSDLPQTDQNLIHIYMLVSSTKISARHMRLEILTQAVQLLAD